MCRIRFRAAVGAGTAAAGSQMERLCQIQFRRRQQRPGSGSGRCADQGDERRAGARGQGRLRPTVSPAARRATGRCANFWRRSSSAPPASSAPPTKSSSPPVRCRRSISSTAFCWRAATPSSSSRNAIRARSTGWTRLGVNAVGIPLDRDGMRMDALAAALDDLKRRGVRPKYIYTIPTVQNPTGTILSEARRHELLRLAGEHGVPIFEDDCYADLIWDGKRPPALYAMSKARRRHPYRLVLQIDRAGVARRLHRRRMGAAVAHAGAQDRRRLRRAGANGARRILPGAFRRPCAGADARLARKARNA